MRLAGYAEPTRASYARTLRDVQDQFHAVADYLQPHELLEFLADRQEHVGPSTLNINACALKYYFNVVLGRPEPVATIPIIRQPKPLGDLLTTAELRRLFDAAAGHKHRAVLALLFGLGLRAGEVGRIRLHDFDRSLRTLTIRQSKGGKDRVLPYDDGLRRYLIPYFRATPPTDYLFTSATRPAGGAGMSIRGVQYIVRTTVQAAGIAKSVCPHTLRHCYAIQYLNQAGNLVRLKQLLGHANLTTTLRYLSYANPELKDIDSPLSILTDA